MPRILPALLLLGCTQAQPSAPALSPADEQALIMDGGCGIINVSFDVAADRIESVACNGDG